jgi:UDP-N-acetylmuramoyl-L-alanyl-D-glutamate--2,6-diaminopimelate ligase
MKLKTLLEEAKTKYQVFGNLKLINEIEILDIAINSKTVSANSVFFGLIGLNNDGANFIQDSVNIGVKAVIIDHKSKFDYQNFLQRNPQIILIISNSFELLVDFLKTFYQPLPTNIYAITGTNGKTSSVEFVRQILEFLGKKSASIGTLGVNCDDEIKNQIQISNLTTPDIVSLYKNLFLLKKYQIDDVAIEVSSIGLEQKRVAGLNISLGAFTNFTQDHLDYHQNMQSYFVCKMLLFSNVLKLNDFAVLNSDIEEFNTIEEISRKNNLKIISYGFKAKDLILKKIEQQKVTFSYQNNIYEFDFLLSGDFQAFNILCALACVLARNKLDKEQIEKLLKNFKNLKSSLGRMQKVAELKNKAQVFIDFAHSPDALENILKLARKLTSKRIFLLFGCGGDRDQKKRPLMAEIACRLSDLVIVTDDNPRTEDPAMIRKQIISKCNIDKTIEIADRKEAITKAIQLLQDNDILILAGKGHEKYQIIGSNKIDFDEEKIVKDAITKLS